MGEKIFSSNVSLVLPNGQFQRHSKMEKFMVASDLNCRKMNSIKKIIEKIKIMETLNQYNISELKELAIYLHNFQLSDWIEPENSNVKQCWIESLTQMITHSDPTQYILELRKIIRWFLDHDFIFERPLNLFHFQMMIGETFIFTITEHSVKFEDKDKASININRTHMNLYFMIPYNMRNRDYSNISSKFYMSPPFYSDGTRPDYDPQSDTSLDVPPSVPPSTGAPSVEPSVPPSTGAPSNEPESVEEIVLRSLQVLNEMGEEEVNKSLHILREMKEMRERVKQRMKNMPDEPVTDKNSPECQICLTNKINVVLAKCGHTFCHSCTERFHGKCAQCRTEFDGLTRIHIFI